MSEEPRNKKTEPQSEGVSQGASEPAHAEPRNKKTEPESEAKQQQPKIISLKPRQVQASKDMEEDQKRLKRLLESEGE